MKCGNYNCPMWGAKKKGYCACPSTPIKETCGWKQPLTTDKDAGVIWPFWMITLFWEEHKGKDGCNYKGGYETYCINQDVVDFMIEYNKKYGDIVKLINSVPINEGQFNKWVDR